MTGIVDKMEDSACDGGGGPSETESLWVWAKPAAFYNVLEARYHQNVSLLQG